MRTQFPELKTLRPEIMPRSGGAFGGRVVLSNPSAINRGIPAIPYCPVPDLLVSRDGATSARNADDPEEQVTMIDPVEY